MAIAVRIPQTWHHHDTVVQMPFSDLVATRFDHQEEARTRRRAERSDELKGAFEKFTEAYGDIVEAHWCIHQRAAVALTSKRAAGRWARLRGPTYRVHFQTAEAARSAPDIAAQLLRYQMLAVRVTNVLRGMPARFALTRIVYATGRLLDTVDETDRARRARGRAPAVPSGATREAQDLERYYRRAATRSGRATSMVGMVAGLMLLGLASVVVWAALDASGGLDGHRADTRTIALCVGAGALGALASLMSGFGQEIATADSDAELSRWTLVLTGLYRPFVGAIFGAILFAGIRSSVLPIDLKPSQQTADTYAVFAFLAGFSERWARGLFTATSESKAETR
jgi:hypothetical protein